MGSGRRPIFESKLGKCLLFLTTLSEFNFKPDERGQNRPQSLYFSLTSSLSLSRNGFCIRITSELPARLSFGLRFTVLLIQLILN
ncbi:hypothetical protein L1987_19956 [Smallanthus sonchifolius]|uniref:Uncharacterized protein n=1 Tax=Smallanthus sonchifolius TaxID=185202 RepID=A0ACB9IQQ1_9ASTR|nr:hypothetical protein L1987_19956 [Smallanthus sonchifolius]